MNIKRMQMPMSGSREDIADKIESFKCNYLPIGLETVVYIRGPVPKGLWLRFLEWLGRRCFKWVGFEEF